jgi:membrane-associated protein
MELVSGAIDLFLHLDKHLNDGAPVRRWDLHLILFLIVFCETGLVVTPFRPGDSLLFAVGRSRPPTAARSHVGWVSVVRSAPPSGTT